jgi:glycosyltransferase involved in cell wall biosynthesis
MNVLLAAYACIPNAGTEPGHGWNWALHLSERGMKVTVLTRTEARSAIEAHLRDHPNPNLDFAYVQLPTTRLKAGTGLHYALWQWHGVKTARLLHLTRRFDVIHHVTYGSIHVPSQLWRIGVPIVFGPIGGGQIAPPEMLAYFGTAQWSERLRTVFTKSLPYSPWHRRWIKKMSAVMAVNSDTLELIRRMGRQQVWQEFDIAVPVDLLADCPRSFPEALPPIRLLWIGRIVPRKGLFIALDALATTEYPSTLTIIGEASDEAWVRKAIAGHELTDRVHWTGKRWPWPEVQAAYLNHDALLFTSVRETCGAQLLEAMAVGLPIITLDLHGARDLVPDQAGMKIPVASPAQVVRDLAAAVDRFAGLPPAEKNAMSRSGWAFATRNTWTARAETAARLYDQVLSAS